MFVINEESVEKTRKEVLEGKLKNFLVEASELGYEFFCEDIIKKVVLDRLRKRRKIMNDDIDNFERELLTSIDPKYVAKKEKRDKRRQQMEKNKELRKMLDELEDALL